jgi:hypothetical protein
MLKKVRDRCLEAMDEGQRPAKNSILLRALNDPEWNEAWQDSSFAQWCLDNLL